MMQVGTNQPASYHSQPSLSTSGGGQQPGRSSSGSRQSQSQSQYHNEQQTATTAGSTSDIRPRCCILRRWPHYDGYGVHLARNQHWHGLRIGDVEPNSPAESGGLLREDVVLAVNGHSVENDDFFVILAFIQQELEEDQIRFLVLDPHSADLARRQQLHIDENIPTCVRMETPMLTVSPEKVLYDQWRTTNTIDPISAQNTIQLGPTLSNQSSTLSTQQHQDGRDDVYTFMPYSDRAAENGKLFFDILFEQPKFTHDDSLSKPRDEYSTPPAIRKPIEKIQPTSTIESGEYDKKKRGSGVGEGVKHLVQSSLENLKSYLPSKQQHPSIDDEKENTIDQKRKNSTDSTQGTTRPESPTLLEKLKNKLGRSSGSAASTGEDQHQPYERLWQASSQQPEDSNNNLRSEPRLCSLTLRPGVDHLGISLQPDRDFSHIIKQIEPNSAADRAGMEPDDCIMSINETPVLNIPYEDVLALLKKTRNMPNVDFLVAKKSYLLKPGQNNVTGGDLQRELPGKYSDTTTPGQRGEVLPSSNLTASGSTAAPAVQTLEQLYRKYTSKQQMPSTFDERASPTRPFRETVSTTTNPSDERVLSRSDSDYAGRYPSKQSQPPPPQQQQQGQIIQGVGPATADRSPWGASGGKSSDESPAPVSGSSSVRSWTRGDQRSGADEAKSRGSGLEDAFKPLQIGITNPNSVSSNAPDISLKDDEQYSPRSAPGFEPSSYSTGDLRKDLPSSDPSAASTRRDDSTLSGLRQPPSIQEIGKVSPLAPAAGKHDYETGPPHILPSSRADVDLANLPLSELEQYGYELHEVQLMQPTETSPVGLKLTKQQEPLQYIITAVAKGTKADLAGLKVNDWLIKIEDRDVRNVEFAEVSQEIRQLLTSAGLINMVIARQSSSASTPTVTAARVDESSKQQQQPPPPPPPASISRQQGGIGGQAPTSLLTTDITRDTPDNSQVRFVPEKPSSPTAPRRQRSPIPAVVPLSVGLTNPPPSSESPSSPRSQSRSPSQSPTRDYIGKKPQRESEGSATEPPVRHVTLKEALGLDFNSFIPEGDSQVQTHFISNVQPSSMADMAGLRDGDRILSVNGFDVTHSVHEDVRRMMQSKKPLQLSVVNDPKYLELIENVKRGKDKGPSRSAATGSPPPDYESLPRSGETRNATIRTRPPLTNVPSDSDIDTRASDVDSPKGAIVLFTDDKGDFSVKHCILRKDPSYNGYGIVLRYQNGLHLIDQVEPQSPAYNCGLRENDIILFINKSNAEQMTHDDVKILIRKLSMSNTDIDLILANKNDIPRYKIYEENHPMNWSNVINNETTKPIPKKSQTEQQAPSGTRSSADESATARQVPIATSVKQQAPVPPSTTSSTASLTTRSPLPAGARLCTLIPSPNHTAGFALSGKTPPPFHICQIEQNSPAEKGGLILNDILLSINGKSVADKTYDETVKIIREALQQSTVELIVKSPTTQNETGQSSSMSDQTKSLSIGSGESNTMEPTGSGPPGELRGSDPSSSRGANAVEEYKKQRNKELSYTLRLCHLHATNGDGNQPVTFGFELSEEPGLEYPLIARVEHQSPAEGAGLQSRDILLKINERKTKGLGYDKAKKEIEKAKRDGRLEMLVVDQEAYDYCKRTKKALKEPDIKIKHIFPKSRSSASFPKLPSSTSANVPLAATRDNLEQSKTNESLPQLSTRLSIAKEIESEDEDLEKESEKEEEEKPTRSEQRSASASVVAPPPPPPPPSSSSSAIAPTKRPSRTTVNFELAPAEIIPTPALAPPAATASAASSSHPSPLRFTENPRSAPDQSRDARQTPSSTLQSIQPAQQATGGSTTTATKGAARSKNLPHVLNNFFYKIGHPKSSKPEYDSPPQTIVIPKLRAPSPPTVRIGNNRLEDTSRVSHSLDATTSSTAAVPISSINDTYRSTMSTGSFDYLRGPRRCVIKVDRSKGLGFVLSATGDYDHTITAVEQNSAADIAGLQVNDEVFEIDGVDVRNIKYEQVVDMLVAAMRSNDTIEMRVIDGRSREVFPTTATTTASTGVLNSNNNNNTPSGPIHSQRTPALSAEDLSDVNSSIGPFDSLNQQKIATSYPNLPGQLRQLDYQTNRALSGSVPTLATGITASPTGISGIGSFSASSEKGSVPKLSDISAQEAPVARLCRIRKFPTSPFYGFFLCGDPKKLGRVFISDVAKHSPAAVCGLRDGDRIIEINGSTIDKLTYETILDKIKEHMGQDNLELLVLDKKSLHWFRERNYPTTSRTLPTIIHIEPIINDVTQERRPSQVPATFTKLVGFADRRVSKTGL